MCVLFVNVAEHDYRAPREIQWQKLAAFRYFLLDQTKSRNQRISASSCPACRICSSATRLFSAPQNSTLYSASSTWMRLLPRNRPQGIVISHLFPWVSVFSRVLAASEGFCGIPQKSTFFSRPQPKLHLLLRVFYNKFLPCAIVHSSDVDANIGRPAAALAWALSFAFTSAKRRSHRPHYFVNAQLAHPNIILPTMMPVGNHTQNRREISAAGGTAVAFCQLSHTTALASVNRCRPVQFPIAA
jgi:hypothetical protein